MRRPRDAKDLKELNSIKLLRGSETHIEKVETKGDLMIALVFPNSYDVAASNLGYNLVWKYLNQLRHVRCERFFFDENFQKFYSLDTQTPIDQFQIWAFVLHFENDLLNVLKILLKKSVPLKSVRRSDFHPIVLFGGALCYTDLPVLKKIADVVLHGDIEPMLEGLDRVLRPGGRKKILEGFATLPFSSVPALSKNFEEVSFCHNLDDFPPVSPLITARGEFAGKLLVELERGCIHRCSFCMMGKLKKPARFLSLEKLGEILDTHGSVGLIASNVTDYPSLDRLIDLLEMKRNLVSVSSLRLDRLTERFLNFLRKHQESITIAPESASSKIREILKKDLTDAQIERALHLAKNAGFDEIKMYFMFGLDEETEQDLSAIGDLARHALELGFKKVKLSINPFVPKRGTELEKRRMQDAKTLQRKMTIISSSVPKAAKVTFESLRESQIQYAVNNLNDDASERLIDEVEMKGVSEKLFTESFKEYIMKYES